MQNMTCTVSLMLMFASAIPCLVHQGQAKIVEVHHVGEMRKVMREGDLTATIDLNRLSKMQHLYALGPIEGLRGEVTIWDSKPSIARIIDDKVTTTESFQNKACFLVYANVEAWEEVPIPQEISNEKTLEKWLEQTATRLEAEVLRRTLPAAE